jgi:hypothetical protein
LDAGGASVLGDGGAGGKIVPAVLFLKGESGGTVRRGGGDSADLLAAWLGIPFAAAGCLTGSGAFTFRDGGLGAAGSGDTAGDAVLTASSVSNCSIARSRAVDSRSISTSATGGWWVCNCPINAFRARSYTSLRDSGVEFGKLEMALDRRG